MPTFTQDTIIVPLVRCHELPMFEGHPLAVTAQLEAAQIEITVLHHNGDSFESTRLTFLCLPTRSNTPASWPTSPSAHDTKATKPVQTGRALYRYRETMALRLPVREDDNPQSYLSHRQQRSLI